MSRPTKRFRGWRVVGAGAVVQGLQSAVLMQGFQHYAVLLEQDFGWSKTTLASVYSLNRVESGLLGPLHGWALDRWGPKRIMRVGAVIMGLGFALFSRMNSLWEFFLYFVIIAIGASLSGFLTVTVAVVRWFERKRARALALGSAGFAIGGACAPLLVWALRSWGWRTTALITAFVVVIVIWAISSVFEGGPRDYGQPVDGLDPDDIPVESARPEGVTDIHFTAREAMRTRAFWFISLGHTSALFVVSAVLAHLSLALTSEYGYSLQGASFVAGAVPMVQLAGIGLGGWLGDRVNKRLIAGLAMLGHCGGLLLLTFATSTWMIWAFVVIHGLSWGARGPLMQALRADYFGASSFGQIMGFSSLIVMIGMASGPIIAGSIADSTGSYKWGFIIVAALAGLGTLFFVFATPPPPPRRAPDGAVTSNSSGAGGDAFDGTGHAADAETSEATDVSTP